MEEVKGHLRMIKSDPEKLSRYRSLVEMVLKTEGFISAEKRAYLNSKIEEWKLDVYEAKNEEQELIKALGILTAEEWFEKAEKAETWGKKISFVSKAIQLQSDNANYYCWRGEAYYDKGEYDKAIEDFTKTIQLEPDNANNYGWRGTAYCKKGEYDRAIEDLTTAIQLKPDDSENYHWRGRAYYEKEDYDRAIEDLSKAIQLNPDEAWNYYWRGLAYKKIREHKKAERDCQKAKELEGKK